MSYFGLLCKVVGNPREGVSGKTYPVMSDGEESSTKITLGMSFKGQKEFGAAIISRL